MPPVIGHSRPAAPDSVREYASEVESRRAILGRSKPSIAMTETRWSVAAYLATIILSLAFLAGSLELWKANLRMPLVYVGDALCVQLWVRGVIDHGWYLSNESVGAPFGLDMHDFTLVDSLFLAIMKAISFLSKEPILTINLYYILTYPLSAVTALFVFRRFGMPRAPAIVGSLLFAFLPYHLNRGVSHLFLASYFLVPLVVMICLRLYTDGEVLFRDRAGGGVGRGNRVRRGLGSVAICLLVGCGGIYYAVFSSYLLLVAGLGGALGRRKAYPFWSAAILITLIGLGVVGNLAPKVVYTLQHGPNPEAVVRNWTHTEVLGLRMAELLLPVSGHRVPHLARLREQYDRAQPLMAQENRSSALGVVGSLGFLVLVGGLVSLGQSLSSRLRAGLVVLNIAAVLLGMAGGFGPLLGFAVTPMIRGYNRISVFIAFFSLFAVVLILARLVRLARTSGHRLLVHAGLGVLLLVGYLDQSAPAFVPGYDEIRREFANDAEFVRRAEGVLPPRALVFQLPFTEFPEGMPAGGIRPYDQLRPYVHSRSLRWSFGAMRGRYGAFWNSHVAEQPAGEMVRTLAFAGFGGILIDRAGYEDRGAALETELARQLGASPLFSRDGRYSLFNLTPYATGLRTRSTTEEWADLREAALHPVTTTWRGWFYPREVGADGSAWHWCQSYGEIILTNPSSRSRRVDLAMTLATRADAPALAKIQVPDGGEEDFPVDAKGAGIKKSLVVPPGSVTLRLWCNGPRVLVPGDPRPLVFRVVRYTLSEPEPSAGVAPATSAGMTRK
jgi:phosphoglycerol transferase